MARKPLPRARRELNSARLKPRFTDEAVLQPLMIAGHDRTTAYLANSLGLPLEPGIAAPFPPRSGWRALPRNIKPPPPGNRDTDRRRRTLLLTL